MGLEMFGLDYLMGQSDQDRQRRMEQQRLVDLLTKANTPEAIPMLSLPRQQSFSGNMADNVLAGVSDGFGMAAQILGGGGDPGPSAVEALRRFRESRQQREDYNAQAKAKNESGAKQARAKAEADVMSQDIADKRVERKQNADQEAMRKRQAEDDARRAGVEIAPGMTTDQINNAVARAIRDQQDAGRASIYEERANDIANTAASNRVTLKPGLVERMKKGDEGAFYEARTSIANRPEAASKRDDRAEKDQEDRLDESMQTAELMIRGQAQTDKEAAIPSVKELAAKGVPLKDIWKDYVRNNARLRLDDKRKAESEKFFWEYVYPEYMAAYAERFRQQAP